jgi:FkbM family methyltransferase
LAVPILQGPLRGKRWIVGSASHGCWLGSYEHGKQRLFSENIPRGSTVYDLGANVGFYTLLASHMTGPEGHVVSFEPLPENLVFLHRHVRVNRAANVEVVEAAVSDRAGEASFAVGGNRSVGKLADAGVLTVKTVTIDGFVGSGRAAPPDVMKIDVEGAELSVLRGAESVLKVHQPAIFLATHGDDVRRDCLELLNSWGYDCAPIDGQPSEGSREFLATAR